MEREEGKGWSSKLEGYSLHQKKEEGKQQEEEQELVPESKELKKPNQEIKPLYLEYGTTGNIQERQEEREELENRLRR